MITYLKSNLVAGLKSRPLNEIRLTIVFVVPYAVLALFIGFYSGLFKPGIADSKLFYFLPFTLFIFPSFLEEVFFRGIIIPHNTLEKGLKSVIISTMISTVLFVLWHPLNSLTINPKAQPIFLNPYFLAITFFLGISCSLSYICTKSLWVPVIIHWLNVLVWVLFLGGRNSILE